MWGSCIFLYDFNCLLERETGFEPATSSLGSWHSTTELLPHRYWSAKLQYFSAISSKNRNTRYYNYLTMFPAWAMVFAGQLWYENCISLFCRRIVYDI